MSRWNRDRRRYRHPDAAHLRPPADDAPTTLPGMRHESTGAMDEAELGRLLSGYHQGRRHLLLAFTHREGMQKLLTAYARGGVFPEKVYEVPAGGPYPWIGFAAIPFGRAAVDLFMETARQIGADGGQAMVSQFLCLTTNKDVAALTDWCRRYMGPACSVGEACDVAPPAPTIDRSRRVGGGTVEVTKDGDGSVPPHVYNDTLRARLADPDTLVVLFASQQTHDLFGIACAHNMPAGVEGCHLNSMGIVVGDRVFAALSAARDSDDGRAVLAALREATGDASGGLSGVLAAGVTNFVLAHPDDHEFVTGEVLKTGYDWKLSFPTVSVFPAPSNN